MTLLRDARLKKALDHAPDAHMLPDGRTHLAIQHMAHQAVSSSAAPAREALHKRFRKVMGSWSQPWNAGFATVLLGALVTVLWHAQEVPQAQSEPPALAVIDSPVITPSPTPLSPSANTAPSRVAQDKQLHASVPTAETRAKEKRPQKTDANVSSEATALKEPHVPDMRSAVASPQVLPVTPEAATLSSSAAQAMPSSARSGNSEEASGKLSASVQKSSPIVRAPSAAAAMAIEGIAPRLPSKRLQMGNTDVAEASALWRQARISATPQSPASLLHRTQSVAVTQLIEQLIAAGQVGNLVDVSITVMPDLRIDLLLEDRVLGVLDIFTLAGRPSHVLWKTNGQLHSGEVSAQVYQSLTAELRRLQYRGDAEMLR